MPFAELDAVTVDAYGTLVRLVDPVPALERALRERGVERAPERIAEAFAAENAYYRPRSLEGRDEESLAALRRDCVAVFLDALGAELPVDELVERYMGALEFELIPGVTETLRRLRERGLALAVIGNWDVELPDRLRELGVAPLVQTIVSSASAGVAKPDPAIFQVALEELRVRPDRALHVGDDESDERGAAAAGMRFTPAPLASVLEAA